MVRLWTGSGEWDDLMTDDFMRQDNGVGQEPSYRMSVFVAGSAGVDGLGGTYWCCYKVAWILFCSTSEQWPIIDGYFSGELVADRVPISLA